MVNTFAFGGNKYVAGMSINTRHKVVLKNGVYTNPYGTQIELDTTNYESPHSLLVFALYRGKEKDISEYSTTKLYSLKLFDGDNLIRNFIPVYNTITESAGLYDEEGKKFYGNSGTDEFDYFPKNSN